jgi:hypothetical protein
MKYRLKDRGLRKKLDEISKGDLSDALEVCSAAVASALKRGKPTTIWFGVQPQLSLEITSDMLEEVREYDPHKWNDFPEVEPPEDVWMRVERCVDGRTYHFAARYVPVGDSEDYEWLSEANLSIDVDRFRPWDDPDGEEDEE